MSRFAFTPPEPPSCAIAGEAARFPVRRIFCVGRNYAAHAREMGADPEREPPFFFTKDAHSILADGEPIPYPLATCELHFEGELVVAIGDGGIFGHAIGNDLTRRDLQAAAKTSGRPWDWAKAFDFGAVLGPIHRGSEPMRAGSIVATVDGAPRQSADLAEMIWPIREIIEHLERAMRLLPGDLIYTGTPAGVGALRRGQRCVVAIEGLGEIANSVI